MISKKHSKNCVKRTIFGWFFAIIVIFGGLVSILIEGAPAYAEPNDDTTSTPEIEAPENNTPTSETTPEPNQETSSEENNSEENDSEQESEGTTPKFSTDACQKSLGEIAWLACPFTEKIAEAVDWIYDKIEDILIIQPITIEDGTPIYEIWKYARGVTNIVFIIFLLIVIYSQITGLGIANYGIKKALPKLIVVAILVNLSFIICSLAVDFSNIVGDGLRGLFANVEETAIMANAEETATTTTTLEERLTYADMYGSLTSGTTLTVIGIGLISFESGAIWMLIPVLLGAFVAVASGLITIALRQAVVALLIMISPLAIVAYMLPNTESLFKKWKDLLIKMIIFYPMFSLLFGASSLAGFAIMASAKDSFGTILGMAVQIFPLFFSWSLMKMSGTFLATINAKIRGLAEKPLAVNRAWAESHRELTRRKHLASPDAYTPSLKLGQFLNDRKITREDKTEEYKGIAKDRGLAYSALRNYRKDGTVSAEGENRSKLLAKDAGYQETIERNKNNYEKGLSDVEGLSRDKTQQLRLNKIDLAGIRASDRLRAEKFRGEVIEKENAASFYQRMDDAVNVHFDDLYKGNEKYKMHDDITNRNEARMRYNAVKKIMEGSEENVQYATGAAATAYDSQLKIYNTKMQKHFEYTEATADVVYRMDELTKKNGIANNIDAVLSGMRILNQRGDTDLLKQQLDNILSKDLGGGVQLGTHASQALASFLMFEVKDNDPFLRRFGKYINLETARAFNSNDRKQMYVDYDEYIKGYHTEPNGEVMYAKKGMKQLNEGTSLDNIERTALSNLDDSLKKAYGFDGSDKTWDVAGYLKKREEIQTAFEPAFLSSSLKWLSGSEQINSGVKFWTGYELKQKKEEIEVDGKKIKRVVTDDNDSPVYEWTPVWEDTDNGFTGHEDEVKKYFRRKTRDYFKDQTTNQILGMRTDYREPTVEHLLDMYLDNEDEEIAEARQKEYEEMKAEIQTRYGDEDPKTAKKKRDTDMTNLKREMAGRELRDILDQTGKLEQIYVTKRSGTANNAKDWLRKMLKLDDKYEIYNYLDRKDKEHKKKQQEANAQQTSGDNASSSGNYNDQVFRTRVMTELNDIFEKTGDSPDADADFYDKSLNKIRKEFGEDNEVVKFYEEYRKNNPYSSRGELWEELEKILGNYFSENGLD